MRARAERYRQNVNVIAVQFPFEHDVKNVRTALRQMRIDYPVVLDNDYSIWRAFENTYWPALYFVEPRGRIRDRHFGEGRYEESGRFIQRLLHKHDLVPKRLGPEVRAIKPFPCSLDGGQPTSRTLTNGTERTPVGRRHRHHHLQEAPPVAVDAIPVAWPGAGDRLHRRCRGLKAVRLSAEDSAGCAASGPSVSAFA
jgi:hypothetical protein